ncbi:MAG TPA: tRNA (adenosine(37)-N6)-dimethylallyltransferase MiaA [Candidatus Coprenecus pullistercoris]|nr:tRNA (adenosine(37)-N6)-dimethylallyltransferase MiaA [Candidatus Coprenecus pullistercoris]
MEKVLVQILGPTAAGKTDYAVELAEEYGSPVISCDSRQIFKEMRIGTAPPSEEQLRRVRHYFIFSHSVSCRYSAGQYELDAIALLSELFKEHDRLVMVGGSGLYADAVCYGFDDFPSADQNLRRKLTERAMTEGVGVLAEELRELDPESYAAIDLSNRQRVVRALEVTLSTGRKFSSFKTNPQKKRFFNVERKILTMPREELYARIDRRTEKMFGAGLVDEVRSLAAYRDMPALRTVGYSEVFDYLDGRISLDEAVELVKRNTRRYAKRQITWFNRYL